MTSTRRPISASAALTLMVVVVLPTPPFWLATARTYGDTERIIGRDEGVAQRAVLDLDRGELSTVSPGGVVNASHRPVIELAANGSLPVDNSLFRSPPDNVPRGSSPPVVCARERTYAPAPRTLRTDPYNPHRPCQISPHLSIRGQCSATRGLRGDGADDRDAALPLRDHRRQHRSDRRVPAQQP